MLGLNSNDINNFTIEFFELAAKTALMKEFNLTVPNEVVDRFKSLLDRIGTGLTDESETLQRKLTEQYEHTLDTVFPGITYRIRLYCTLTCFSYSELLAFANNIYVSNSERRNLNTDQFFAYIGINAMQSFLHSQPSNTPLVVLNDYAKDLF